MLYCGIVSNMIVVVAVQLNDAEHSLVDCTAESSWARRDFMTTAKLAAASICSTSMLQVRDVCSRF